MAFGKNHKTASGAVILTEGTVWKRMLSFAFPIFLGQLFQQLYHTADTLIVGRSLGKNALAAVGSTGSLTFLIIGFFMGMGVGAGVVTSRFFGAKDEENLQKSIHTTVALGLAASVLLTAVGVLLAPVFLRWMQQPEDTIDIATSYLRVIFAGGTFMIMYNIFSGILQAVGDSRHPLYYLITSSVINVILDYLFVAVLGGGVEMAALATIMSQFVSASLSCYRLMKKSPKEYTLSLKKLRVDGPTLRLILKMGVPTGIQNSINSLANVIVQSNINVFGSTVMAGCSAFSSLEGFAFLPIGSISVTLATFVSQNIGAREYDRVRQGARFGVIAGPVLSEAIGLTMTLIMPALIGLFDTDPGVIAAGVARGRICAPLFLFCAFTHCVSGVLRGAGKSAFPMYVILGCWCALRVAYIMVIVQFVDDVTAVHWAFPLTWAISAVIMLVLYLKTDWMHGYPKEKPAA